MKKKSKQIELPPMAFTNAINKMDDIMPSFNYTNWRQSPEWRIFVAGYNEAVRVANQKIANQYDMGETAERLFGERK